MAKTFEALTKNGQSSTGKAYLIHLTSKWHCPDLTTTKELLDLSNFITRSAGKSGTRVINFVSSRSGEGTSTVVANLARIIMTNKTAEDVLLIDANRYHPVLHLAFSTPSEPGLFDALLQKASYADSVHRAYEDNLSVIPCGTRVSPASARIGQESLINLISQIRDRYRHVLIDSPPLLSSSDALSLATSSDLTLLIIQANMTKWEVAEKCKRILQDNNCILGGVVLNRFRHVIPKWVYRKT